MQKNHTLIPELDGASEAAKYKIDVLDLMLDLKVLIKEYYTATLTENCNELILKFNNGQTFKLTLTEQK